MKYILAYDLGTGGNKASLFDEDGKLISAVFKAYDMVYPQPGYYEQRPEDWWNATVTATRELLEISPIHPSEIVSLAISGHSLGVVPLRKPSLEKNSVSDVTAGRLVRESTPIWSDKRPTKEAARFFEKIDPVLWYMTTGNGFPAPHYSVFKILWYKNYEPEIFSQIDKVIGTKDYINFRLTGKIATDYSYASGSGVYDLKKWAYSEEFIDAAGLPHEIFPEIVPSTEILGTLTPAAAETLGLPQSVMVMAGGVDNSCMALGAKNTQAGRLYASLGSSSWIAVSDKIPLLDPHSKPYVFTHVIPGMFTSAIGVFSTGTTFRWLRDEFCPHEQILAEKENFNIYDWMVQQAMKSPLGANGLMLNPSFAGGSSLDPSPRIRGALVGLDLSHTLQDVLRAGMEGIAMNMCLALNALKKLSTLADSMVLVGGGSLNHDWCQIYADIMQISLEKTNIGQSAASLGAATLAAVGAGIWNDFSQVDRIHQQEAVFLPDKNNGEKYHVLLNKFQKLSHLLADFAETE
ncbi:MAG: FGGY-family carbohydrate kinase [Planctomycetia bacterium]|nr:FGGY-family carbohydrate kinase [Planctomycetia bacterium]